MESVFLLGEEARGRFLQSVVQSLGCTFICLWSYHPNPYNCLFAIDGWYNDQSSSSSSSQPSSSSGSLARRLFDEYQQSVHIIGTGLVPGLAFKEGVPYLELKELELLARASNETQRQFYQEARIKTVGFMGCRRGEIEIGMSIPSQINMEMELRNWFPADFSQQSQFTELSYPLEHNRPSSSSSSLKSLSMGSPEYSSLYFNIASTYMQESLKEAPIEQAIKPTSTTFLQHQQALQAYNPFRNIQFPTAETDDAAMTRAMLAVISSPSSSLTSQNQATQKMHAFKTYIPALALKVQRQANLRRQNLMKRGIAFFTKLNLRRIEERNSQGTRQTSTQLHHKISERKRREKLNESIQALRSLLPPGTKKDKASVLTSTKDYLTAMKDQVNELKEKNKLLEARVTTPPKEFSEEMSGSSNERFVIQVTQSSESTSEEHEIDLQVTVRGDCDLMDLVVRILEFLKQTKNCSMVSIEADTRAQQTSSFNRVILRLKIEGSEWDESAFREAITRVVADVSDK